MEVLRVVLCRVSDRFSDVLTELEFVEISQYTFESERFFQCAYKIGAMETSWRCLRTLSLFCYASSFDFLTCVDRLSLSEVHQIGVFCQKGSDGFCVLGDVVQWSNESLYW
jgi:hypothetical protein